MTTQHNSRILIAMMAALLIMTSTISQASNMLIPNEHYESILTEILSESTLLQEPCLESAWSFYNQKKYPEAIEAAQECVDLFLIDALIQQKEINDGKRCSGPTGRVSSIQKKCINQHGLLNDVSASLFILIKSKQTLLAKSNETEKAELKKAITECKIILSQFPNSRIWDQDNGWYWKAGKAFYLKDKPLSKESIIIIGKPKNPPIPSTISHDYDETLERITQELGDQLSQANKKTLAVYYFTKSNDSIPELGNILSKELETKLINLSMDFKIVEREELQRVIDELELCQAPTFDKDCLERIGKLLNIDTIITGSLSTWTEEEIVKINIQLIDTSTAEKFGGTIDKITYSGDIEGKMGAIIERK